MEYVELILSGFGIVIGVLTLLWAVTVAVTFITGAAARAGAKKDRPANSTKAVPAGTAPPSVHAAAGLKTSGGVVTGHVAVIAAAVAASFDTPHRLVSVSGQRAHVSAWTQQGLFAHFASHQVPWRNMSPRGPRLKSQTGRNEQ